jgi:WD40 repeat protein
MGNLNMTNLQLGGGYTYQWECAILMALNYFFETTRLSPALDNLVADFLEKVETFQLEGESRENNLELEDINLLGNGRRILVQVKTKQAEDERWTLTDPLFLKALFRFYANNLLVEQPAQTRFVFLTNRPFNPDLVKLKDALLSTEFSHTVEARKLYDNLNGYVIAKTDPPLDEERFYKMLSLTSLVEYLPVESIKGSIQNKLQALGRRDWEIAHAVLFEHFARQSTLQGGGRITREVLSKVLAKPLEITQSPGTPEIRIPQQAPAIKPGYLPRPRETEIVVNLLTQTDTLPSLRKIAIYGLPGSGKSTLAVAVAHEAVVQKHFPDGILWTSLGQEPNLVEILGGWVQELGDYQFKSGDVKSLQSHLNGLVREKAILTVVDDAWSAEAASLAIVGGERCAVLLTSREAGIARLAEILPDCLYEIPVMDPDLALQLLAGSPGSPPSDEELAKGKEIARLLGYLPLALELAAAQTHGADSLSWDDLLLDLGKEVARLESLDDPSLRDLSKHDQRKRFSLVSSINLSLKQLKPPDLEKFAWLGVLPEDVEIQAKVAATLWELDEREARAELRYFRDKALLSLDKQDQAGKPSYRLHDTLHDIARRLLVDPLQPQDETSLPGLGLTWEKSHQLFLDRYRSQLDGKNWTTLPEDGYITSRLAWHMVKANLVDELHSLLLNFDWLQRRLAEKDRIALLADYRYLPEDSSLRVVSTTLRLAAHILDAYPDQLALQLSGRLKAGFSPEVDALLSTANRQQGHSWLKLHRPTLLSPGGPLVQTIPAHSATINGVAVTTTGKMISVANDGQVKVWDLSNGNLIHAISGHRDQVTCVAVTPDGKTAVSGSKDKTLKLWDIGTGGEIRTFSTNHPVEAVIISPDGRKIIAAAGPLYIWDLDTNAMPSEYPSFAARSLAMDNSGRFVYGANIYDVLLILDLEQNSIQTIPYGTDSWPTAVAVTPNGDYLFGGGDDGTIKAFPRKPELQSWYMSGHTDRRVRAIAILPDGRGLVSAEKGEPLSLWDLERRQMRLLPSLGNITAIAVTQDSRYAVTGSESGSLQVWDLSAESQGKGMRQSVTVCAISPNGQFAVIGMRDGQVSIIDIASGDLTLEVKAGYHAINQIRITRDSRYIVTISPYDSWNDKNGQVVLLDLKVGEEIFRMPVVGDRAIHQNSRYLVAFEYPDEDKRTKGRLLVVDETGGEGVYTAYLEEKYAFTGLSPNGLAAILQTQDGAQRYWDLASRRLLDALEEVTQQEIDPTFQTGQQESLPYTISLSNQNDLELHSIPTGQLLARFTADSPISHFSLSLDGKTVVAGTQTGQVHFLRVEG